MSWLRFLFVLFAMLLLRLGLAAYFPLTNDEAYYWDWGRDVQLSYFDHPPGVAWMTFVAQHIAGGSWAARLLAPGMHALACVFLAFCIPYLRPSSANDPEVLSATSQELMLLLCLTQLVPGFSLWGCLALPDAGLLLALSMVLFLSLRNATKPGILTWQDGLVLGAAMGLAGLFKYHALPVAGGMALGLVYHRWKSHSWKPGHLRIDVSFWCLVVITGLVCTLPVWLWNIQNNFVSFRFQSQHGFGGLHLNLLAGLRAYLGQLIFLTPLIAWALLKLVFGSGLRSRLAGLAIVPLLGFLPLFVLIESVSLFKQTLPHWVMPAFWLLIPLLAATGWGGTQAAWRRNAVFAGVITWILPGLLAFAPLRDYWVARSNGDPGYISELTMWPDLARTVEAKLTTLPLPDTALAQQCGTKPLVASLRWFWTAQLAFHMTGQPRIYALDATGHSYYEFRDDWQTLKGCPIVVVADRRHFDATRLAPYIQLASEEVLLVPGYEKLSIVWLTGVIK